MRQSDAPVRCVEIWNNHWFLVIILGLKQSKQVNGRVDPTGIRRVGRQLQSAPQNNLFCRWVHLIPDALESEVNWKLWLYCYDCMNGNDYFFPFFPFCLYGWWGIISSENIGLTVGNWSNCSKEGIQNNFPLQQQILSDDRAWKVDAHARCNFAAALSSLHKVVFFVLAGLVFDGTHHERVSHENMGKCIINRNESESKEKKR